MEEKLDRVKQILSKNNQEHLLCYYDDLSTENKNLLLEQILNIDFELMHNLYLTTKKPVELDNDVIEPIPYIDKSKLSNEDFTRYNSKGIEAIKNGKLAVVTMAGGQGTRLRT